MTAAAPEEAFIWANYALVAAAVLYIYDCIITFSAEVRLVQANIMKLEGHRRLLLQFVPLRYFALFYHVTIICGVSMSELRPKSCGGTLDNLVMSLDCCFQIGYVFVISWRAHSIWNRKWFLSIPLAVLGLLPVLINIIVPNPSIFPECRAIHPSPASEIVLLVPCFRATFDAIACIIVYSAVGRAIRKWKKFSTSTLPSPHEERLSELFAEGIQELGMIFVIMTVEAVFVQMPSVRAHARNYIAPFVDSWTAILTTRFILRLAKRKPQEPDDSSSTHSRSSWPLSDEETVWEPEPDSSPMIAAWPARVVDGLSPIEFGAAWRHAEALSVRDGDGLHSIAETQRVRAISALTPEKPPKSTLGAEAGLAAGCPLASTQNVPVDQGHGNPEFDRTFLTADGSPPKLCIPLPPLGGWYLPTGIERHTLLDPVDPEQIESWEMLEQDGPSSFATLAGDSVDPPHEARLIHSNLADLLNVQRYSFKVCPAMPRIATAGQNPNVFFITGLSEFLNDAIQRQQVVSAPGITFFIYPPHPHPQFSGFMGTIVGLEFEDSVAGDSAALEAICSAVMVNKRFTSAVLSHCDPLPAGVCSEDILTRLQNSIAIRPIELRPTEPHTADQGHRIAYRVYADLPTTNPSAYRAIRIAFRRTRVIQTMGLFGTVINDFAPCRICRSIDHPAPLCPYPKYPGWRGATAATIAALDEAAHEHRYTTGNGGGDHMPSAVYKEDER